MQEDGQEKKSVDSECSYFSAILAGKRALLAEDVPVNQIIAQRVLSQAGMQVDTAINGREAVAMATQSQYDIIIMDIQMPEMDGYEATALIRQLDNYKTIPIVETVESVSQRMREGGDIFSRFNN